MRKNNYINQHYLFLLLTVIKLTVIILSDNNLDVKPPFTVAAPFYTNFLVNNDELDIASVAINYNKGLGFVTKSDYFSRGELRPTAWRTSYPVFIHIALQRIYQHFYPEDGIVIDFHHRYFYYYGLLMQILSVLVFWVSLYFFYQTAIRFLGDEKQVIVSVVLYTLLPSVLYYVGSMVCYENIALGCVIIVTAIYYQFALQPNKISWKGILLATLFSVWASLLRPHTILIFLFLMGACLLISLIKRYKFKQTIQVGYGIRLIVINILVMVIMQLPALYKNYQIFGKYTLSTQADYNFLLGHNEYARGSWLGNSGFNTEWDKYIASQIPGIENMNEYEEAQARKKIAVQWIKDNPEKELWLIARKTAIFFLPDNYLHHQEYINVSSLVNAIIFICFIVSGIQLLIHLMFFCWKEKWLTDSVIYIPVLGSLIFSILFFIDHRWRYYAEPFILLIAFRFILSLLSRFNIHLLYNNIHKTDIENQNNVYPFEHK